MYLAVLLKNNKQAMITFFEHLIKHRQVLDEIFLLEATNERLQE
jgi:hypothetical protein